MPGIRVSRTVIEGIFEIIKYIIFKYKCHAYPKRTIEWVRITTENGRAFLRLGM